MIKQREGRRGERRRGGRGCVNLAVVLEANVSTVLVGGAWAKGVAMVHVLQWQPPVTLGQLVNKVREILCRDVTGYRQNPQQVHTVSGRTLSPLVYFLVWACERGQASLFRVWTLVCLLKQALGSTYIDCVGRCLKPHVWSQFYLPASTRQYWSTHMYEVSSDYVCMYVCTTINMYSLCVSKKCTNSKFVRSHIFLPASVCTSQENSPDVEVDLGRFLAGPESHPVPLLPARHDSSVHCVTALNDPSNHCQELQEGWSRSPG